MDASSDKKQHKLTEQEYLIPFVMITLLFFLWGFARAILDVLNKHFQNELGYNYHPIGMDSGYNLFRIFPHGHTFWYVYQ